MVGLYHIFKKSLKISFFIILFSGLLFSKENYVLLTLDTVRCDHFSLYGYEKDTTPFLKSIKKDRIVFENAYTLVPLTFPSHITMLTGKTPFETGIFLNGQKLEEEENYLPKIFKKRGYRTAGFISSAILNSIFGLSQGFDIFSDVAPEKGGIVKERSCKKTNEEVIKFLKNNGENFFLWVHYFESHAPYEPPEPYKSQFENPYDGEIRAMDDCIRELFQNLPKETTIVIAGDHGEMLGEHGEEEHGVLLYEPAIKVPLILIKRGIKSEIRKDFVSLDKIFNTFLNFLGEGKETLLEKGEGKPILSSTLYGREVLGFYPAYSTIFQGFKLINYADRDYLLFNLIEDPKEKRNIFNPEEPKVRELKKVQDQNPFPETLKLALKDEEKKVLTSLGYSAPRKLERLIHPEIGLLLEKELKKAEKLFDEKKYGEAEEILTSILQREPNYILARKLLGKIYLKTGQTDKASGTLSGFATQPKEFNPREEARKNFLEGKLEEAIKIMESEVSLNPFPQNFGDLALYYYAGKKFEKLKELYEKARNKNVKSPLLLSFTGFIKLQEKDKDKALELFEEAISLNPKLPEALKGKAIVLFLNKNYEEAIEVIENYIGLRSKDWEGYYYKGKILKEKGDLVGSKYAFEKSKEFARDPKIISFIEKELN